ncbi:calmodulin [Acrasis kona]|uniref:Calmodulin n=1 Tax=Acrasis kona TaxID=1008807 RepID=A0AAW2Z8K5_9EUKA
MPKLPCEQLQKYLELFHSWDKDGDHVLSIEDLKLSYQRDDSPIIVDLMYDVSMNRTVMNPSRFIAWIKTKGTPAIDHDHEIEDRLRQEFDKVDADLSGTIDSLELLDLMHRLGHTYADHDFAKSMILSEDHNGDGLLQFSEFKKLMADRIGLY